MSAVHFVSADAPPDDCAVSRACKFLTLTLAKVCGDEVQRVANWHCMTLAWREQSDGIQQQAGCCKYC